MAWVTGGRTRMACTGLWSDTVISGVEVNEVIRVVVSGTGGTVDVSSA